MGSWVRVKGVSAAYVAEVIEVKQKGWTRVRFRNGEEQSYRINLLERVPAPARRAGGG